MSAARRASPRRVRVRESLLGRELRIDDTFASCYRPGSAVTGSVWDALAAPLLALPPARRGSILLLGLGGGSAARVFRALAPAAQIVGVEVDRGVLEAARRDFDLDALGLEVVLADAREHLTRESRRFDLVLEDVFIGRGRCVRKPHWLPDPGLALAARLVRPGGLLVTNALDEACASIRSLRRLYPGLVQVEVDDYDNRILVGGPSALAATLLRQAVSECELLAGTLPRLRFRSLAKAKRRRAVSARASSGS